MRTIATTQFLTLDGVMQAPAHADEDRRDGFTHGGWTAGYADEVLGAAMGQGMAQDGDLLFGRRTYEQFAGFWPHQPDDDPYAAVLNRRQKYVASTTLRAPLPWQNSTLLEGDAIKAVAELKEQPGGGLAVLGSGALVQSLMHHDLIDVYTLLIHPVVLGTGRRLFPDGGVPARLRLVDTTVTTTGVIIATYERGAAPAAATG